MDDAVPSERFRDLLGRLASEHEREVRRLRAEVARLRELRDEDEVASERRSRSEGVRSSRCPAWGPPARHRKERQQSPRTSSARASEQDFRSWLPLCHGCRDGTGNVAEEEEDDSTLSAEVVDPQPVLTTRSVWQVDRIEQRSHADPSSPRSSPRRSRAVKGTSDGASNGPDLVAASRGDVSGASDWLDPTHQIALELNDVEEDDLDLARHSKGSKATFDRERVSSSSYVSKLGGAKTSVNSASDISLYSATSASPLECWRLLITYARGHVQVKNCWAEAVDNWKRCPRAKSTLDLSKILTMVSNHEEAVSAPRRRFITRCTEGAVFHPNNKLRMLWDLCGVLLLMHDLIMLPMGVFNEGTTGFGGNYGAFLRVFDWTSACFWTMDMFVSFFTGYLTAEGFIELKPYLVMRHYLRTWFPMDLFIVVTDWVALTFDGIASTTSNFLRLGKAISRSLRVLRLLRFIKLNATVRDLLAMINSEYILTLLNLLKILLFMVIMNHYLACFWYMISVSLKDTHPTWISEALGDDVEVRFAYAYSTALHWSLTQFTPASMEVFPENEYERFFNIVVIIFALVVFSSFVSGITQAMTHIRNINAARMAREGEIRVFLSSNKISHKLASRIWRSVRQNNTTALGQRRLKGDDIPLLRMLPEPIKEELRQEVFVPVISSHPFFREYFSFDPDVVATFCSTSVTEASLRTGEDALLDWKIVKEMVFVIDGFLEYHPPFSGEKPSLVSKGEWACETALWAMRAELDGPLVAGSTGCEIVKVHAAELQKLAEAHPASADFLGRYAKVFVQRFNNALFHDDVEREFFNDPSIADLMVCDVIKQCGKARGLGKLRRTPAPASGVNMKFDEEEEDAVAAEEE